MKNKKWIIPVFLLLALCFLFVTPVFAQTPTPQPNGDQARGDKVVFGETYRLQSGETLNGDLVVIGGTATIEANAVLTGDIVLIGGTITIDGKVTGNLVAVGGAITLGDDSKVDGNIVTASASLKKSETAVVTGSITEQTPALGFGPENNWQFPWQSNANFLSRILAITFESLAVAALAAVIGLVLPKQVKCIANSIGTEPLVSGGVGLLVLIGSPILMVILIITLILIPVAAIYAILFALAILFGWITLGYFLGEKLAASIHVKWAEPIVCGIGVLILNLVVGLLSLIPCVGWIFGALLSLISLGAVTLTRFGSTCRQAAPLPTVVQTAPPPAPTTPGPTTPAV
jgi:cytoskeletal protein CcmA (bactofilin family)